MPKLHTLDALVVQAADAVTVLHCIEPNRANKIIHPNGEVEDFNAGMFFIPETYPVNGIQDLADLLEALETSPHRLVIRGQIKSPYDVGTRVQRLNAVFDEKPRRYLCVDTEALRAPEGMNPISDEAFEYVVAHLPPELHGVSFIGQFSSQAGTRKAGSTIRAHLWFWLDRPYRDHELKRWGQQWNERSGLGEGFIDTHLYQQVQPHYTAAPGFEDPKQNPLPNGRTRVIVKGRNFAALKLPEAGWKPKKKNIPARAAVVTGAVLRINAEVISGDDGRLTDGREERARDIRFGVFQRLVTASQLTLERFIQESWAQFERECVTSNTVASPNTYGPESWADRCKTDFDRLSEKLGVSEVAEPYFKSSPIPREVVQARVAQELREFLVDEQSRLIRVPPGLGKTEEAARQLARLLPRGKVVHMFVPTHNLAGELKALFERDGAHLRVQVIAGRNKDNCQRYTRVEDAVAAGLPVRASCCVKEVDALQGHLLRQGGNENLLKKVEGKLCSICPYFDECLSAGYESQFRRSADIFIFATKHLGIAKRAEIPKADYVIVDEQFFTEICETTVVELTKWHAQVPMDLRKVVDGALVTGAPLLKALREAGWTDDRLLGVLSSLSEAMKLQTLRAHPHEPAFMWKKSDRRITSSSRKLIAALHSEIGLSRDRSNKVRLVNGAVRICELKDAGRMDAPTVFLDGTGNAELVQRVKPGAKLVQIDVERQARVVQVSSNRVGVSSLKDGAPDREGQMARLQALIDRYTADYERALVVTYKAIEGALGVPEGWEKAHFGAVRGINRWKDVEAVFVIGNWNKPLYLAEDMAAALWGVSSEELAFSDTPVQEWRGYRMRTGRQQVQVSVHPDRRVQLCLEQMREAEAVQAIDRARLIWAKEKKDVYLVSSPVLDVTVDKVIDLDELAYGSLLETVLITLDGAVPLSKPLLCTLLPDLFPSESSAHRLIEEVRQSFKGSGSNIRNLLGPEPLKILYRKAGQAGGRATECLFVTGHSTPRATLEKLVGRLSYYHGPAEAVRPIKFQAASVDGIHPDSQFLDLVKGVEAALTPSPVQFKPPREWAMFLGSH